MKKTGEKLDVGTLELVKEKRKWDSPTVFLSIALALLLVCIISTLLYMHTNSIKFKEKEATIQKLIDANNSLTERVVSYEEKNREKAAIIRDYIIKYHRTIPPIVVTEIAKNIMIASEKYNLPVGLIVAVIERESKFNPTLISKKGARGLMQVMRSWVEEKELNVKSRFEFHDIEKGINAGAYVLRKYLNEEGHNMKRALLKYVHYDNQYVLDVYNSMGKFVVYEGLSKKIVEEVTLELDEEEMDMVAQTHTVVEGDTFSLIAKKYTGNIMNWKKIQELNPTVDPLKIQIGSTIILPLNTKQKNI